MESRKPRKSIVGRVVSDAMNKTIAVSVERIFQHPTYKKMIKRTSKIYAHDEERQAHVGDLVKVMSTRPLSKMKRWRVVEVLEKAK
ncbi:MAG: 30S ribosomal protein S17 [Candidatus Krumholzibacteriaceae bacterium]|jgi:small subunit ribosomal protein S17